MRNYEIVIMIHPDYSEKVTSFINEYKNMILKDNGKIHRIEDWGRRQLSYKINNLHKAHYLLMNIEVYPLLIKKLEEKFRFNDIIIRNLITLVKKPISNVSVILKKEKENKKVIQDESNTFKKSILPPNRI
ncbi:30S ribosomal protein S6 [Buchnera aphidicola (Tetraneura ulmi)]|uniref:30S ribosomal protein S6 n=1 Tax=Buchnera aphidicola TaxID=9 RepID=UPI003463F4E8